MDEAANDAETALALARNVGAPQALLPAIPAAARTALAAGESDQAASLLAELLEAWPESRILAGFWAADTAVVACALGEQDAFAEAAAEVPAQTRWLDAACAFAAGEAATAADIYATIGSLPDEAYARLCAAEAHLAAGRRAEADAEAGRALTFHRATGARLYIGRAEALLPASA